MAHTNVDSHSLDDRYVFSGKAKRTLAIIVVVGIVLFGLGVFQASQEGGEHHAEAGHNTHGTPAAHSQEDLLKPVPGHSAGHTALLKKEKERTASHYRSDHEAAGEGFSHDKITAKSETEHGEENWTLKRIFANLWINNIFFCGLAIIGVFFYSLQFAASAGWSAGIKRIPLAFGSWLPIAGVLMVGIFFLAQHDLFHWTHHGLYDEKSPEFDEMINGKKGYLNLPFFVIRTVVYFIVWYIFFYFLRREAVAEDLDGSPSHYKKSIRIGAFFIIFFAISNSMSSWDWVMSIDTHWFSTMFGWYYFASWWVSGLAAITLVVVFLKDAGYLKFITQNHLHDLGKFVFAFSIFWTYIWFSQFFLIWYANIPEETIYFMERLNNGKFAPIFFLNIFLNFIFPFLLLMTRDAKRQATFLKLVCIIVLVGHWLDFWLMVTPGTLRNHGGLGFMELGMTMVFAGAFVFTVLTALARLPLVAKHHPMLEESLHHHI